MFAARDQRILQLLVDDRCGAQLRNSSEKTAGFEAAERILICSTLGDTKCSVFAYAKYTMPKQTQLPLAHCAARSSKRTPL